MLSETFELTRDELKSQQASYADATSQLGQRNVDRLFLTVGKVGRPLCAVVFWLLLAILVLDPLLALFLKETYSPRLLLMSLPTLVILRLLIRACKQSISVPNALLKPIHKIKFNAVLKRCPANVTWKFENDMLDYKGKTRHLVFKAEHLRGQEISRSKNWIGLHWGRLPVVITLQSEENAIELQRELRRLAGAPNIPVPEKRVKLWHLIVALSLSCAALRFL